MSEIKRPVRSDGVSPFWVIDANDHVLCECDTQDLADTLAAALNAAPDAGDVEALRIGLPVHAVRGAMTDGAVMDAHGRMLMPGEIADLIERLHAALSKSEAETLKVAAELDEAAAREAGLRGALEQAMRLLNTIGVDHELYEYRQLDAALATPGSPAAERAMTVIEAAVIEAACELTDGIRKRSAGFTVNADRLMERVDALRALDGGAR